MYAKTPIRVGGRKATLQMLDVLNKTGRHEGKIQKSVGFTTHAPHEKLSNSTQELLETGIKIDLMCNRSLRVEFCSLVRRR